MHKDSHTAEMSDESYDRLENTYKLLDKMYLPQRETVLHRGQTWWCTFKNSEPKG